MYQFFWGDFCDWYIEWIKPQLAATGPDIALAAWQNIFAALDLALRLLHPVMPFLTEELWHRLPQAAGAHSIALAGFPEPRAGSADAAADEAMATLQEIIVGARQIRAEMKLDPKRKVPADFSTNNPVLERLVEENVDAVLRLATLSELRISSGHLEAAGAAIRSTAQFDLRIGYGEAMDKAAEVARLRKEVDRLAKDIESKQGRLADREFTSKAPPKVVEGLRKTLAERQAELEKLMEQRRSLSELA